MSAMERLTHVIGVNACKLSKEENLVMEAELFIRICHELKEIIRTQNKSFFRLMKLNTEKEDAMIEESFIRCIIKDILATEEYSLPGIACYTQTPEDLVYEITTGNNNNPLLSLPRKVIELHRTVRPHLYKEIINKIKKENLILT